VIIERPPHELRPLYDQERNASSGIVRDATAAGGVAPSSGIYMVDTWAVSP
jgi:hypothetical protein